MAVTDRFLGKGIFSLPEAAALTGLSSAQIRRWITGYQHRDAVFAADFQRLNERVSLSFLDLVEVLFVDSFRKHGVSWSSIRTAAQKAAAMLEYSHPFAKRSFYTDGKYILTRIAEASGDPELLNLVDDQYEIDTLVFPLLYENLDFGDLDIAARWWPRGREAGVFVDPHHNMGRPTVATFNIPTAVLAQLFETVKSAQEVADWYEIDTGSVMQAVEFEASLAA